MPTDPPGGLAGQLASRREAAQREALDSISGLASIARGLALRDTATALAENAAGLESSDFKMIVMGRFKNGKSTLLNALMGGTTAPVDLGGAPGPMVVDDLPATAVLSQVSYAPAPFVKAWKMDSRAEQWTFAQYLRDSTLGDDNEENERRFAEIRQFEFGFPARLCQSRVTLYDSPGLDEHSIRTEVTMDAVRRCDAALMVFGTRSLMGAGELADDARVRTDGTHVFVVVNLFDGRQADDRLRAHVWNKYVRDHLNGPPWAGQDLADYDIYFVNAKMAADGRFGPGGADGAAGQQAYRDSGLAAFEARLARFLIEERFQIHLAAFTKKAVNLSERITQHISQQRAAATTDRDRFRAALAEQQPVLRELGERPKRLPRIVDRYRNEAVVDLTSAFSALVAGIRRDLPGHLEALTLPTQTAATFAVWHQKQLMQEATDEINSFITGRMTDWSRNEADAIMRRAATGLGSEVSEEVAQIGREFDSVNMALTGWDSAAFGLPGNVHSTTERVLATIAGLMFLDPSAAVGGGKGGYRGALGGILGMGVGGWLVLSVLGMTGAIALVPIMAIAAVGAGVAGSAGLIGRIKKKALEAADERLALLPDQTAAQIKENLTDRFDDLQDAISDEVTAFIAEQVRGIEAQVQVNTQQEADKERTLRELKQAEENVLRHRKALENTLAIAKQA